MKKVIAYPVAWGLFWTGHVVSYTLRVGALAFFYPLYNWLMCRSSDVQDWAGLKGPWGPPEPPK
jgi:hypothetical protein